MLDRASFSIVNSHVEEIGPWRIDQLEHASMKEILGAKTLAGWLGIEDFGSMSTLLRMVKTAEGDRRLEHAFSRITSSMPTLNELSWTYSPAQTEEARWMTRKIGELTENQIRQALIASGMDDAQVKLMTAKLVRRRDQMIRELGLMGEIPLLEPNGIDSQFGYDPSRKGPMRASIPLGEIVEARKSEAVVFDGKVRVRGKVLREEIQ